MAAPLHSTSTCVSKLRAMNDRMDRLDTVMEEKFALLDNKIRELRQ
jgi:hypothetical protein